MVNEDLSFENNDDLGRALLAENIQLYVDILDKSVHGSSISIGLNSKWGSGKTYFMNMWKNKLERIKNQKVVMYDAWANDDCGSALLPFLYNIISITDDSQSDATKEYLKNFLKIIVCETSKFGVRKIFGNDSEITKIIENGFDGIKDIDDDKIRTVFKDFDDYYGKRQTLDDTLRQLVRDECKDGRLWVFIDDLDRCEPKFAISTLECIKHFFNIEKIVYVFSIDMEQLQYIARNVYGPQIDTYSYLERFFDCVYDLPDPDIEKYIECKIKKMDVEDSVKQSIAIKDFCKFVQHFQCSLRDLNLIILHLEIFLKSHAKWILENEHDRRIEALKVYYFFMVVKAKYPVQYNRIIHGDFSIGKNSKLHEQLILDDYFAKVDDTTDEVMRKLSEGRGFMEYQTVIKRYNLIQSEAKSFEEYMQNCLI